MAARTRVGILRQWVKCERFIQTFNRRTQITNRVHESIITSGITHHSFHAFVAYRTPAVLSLFCTLEKRSTGIAGKDSSWNSEFGQRLRFASPHRRPSP